MFDAFLLIILALIVGGLLTFIFRSLRADAAKSKAYVESEKERLAALGLSL